MPPTLNFIGVPLSGTVPLVVQFTEQAQGGTANAWDWDFGDGSGSAERDPLHTYTVPGTYTVELTASNHQGSLTETKTDYITVYDNTSGGSAGIQSNGSGVGSVSGLAFQEFIRNLRTYYTAGLPPSGIDGVVVQTIFIEMARASDFSQNNDPLEGPVLTELDQIVNIRGYVSGIGQIMQPFRSGWVNYRNFAAVSGAAVPQTFTRLVWEFYKYYNGGDFGISDSNDGFVAKVFDNLQMITPVEQDEHGQATAIASWARDILFFIVDLDDALEAYETFVRG